MSKIFNQSECKYKFTSFLIWRKSNKFRIKISVVNLVNTQLKNINTLLNTVIEDIKKNNEKLGKLLDECKNFNNNDYQNKNVIKGILDIKSNEINIIRLDYLIQILIMELMYI